MIRNSQAESYMILSTAMDICANIGKYSSILYGIANVVGDKPNIEKAVGAGFAYIFSGFIGHMAKSLSACAVREPLKERLDKITEKLNIPQE